MEAVSDTAKLRKVYFIVPFPLLKINQNEMTLKKATIIIASVFFFIVQPN